MNFYFETLINGAIISGRVGTRVRSEGGTS